MRLALAQMRSGVDAAENWRALAPVLDAAADAGAHLIATPEVTNIVETGAAKVRAAVTDESEDPVVAGARDTARRRGVWILLGSVLVAAADGRAHNRAILIDQQGAIAARYDKIHLFAADIGGKDRYDEARAMKPGAAAVVADTPWGGLGLTICYDLRFPALHRALAQSGARIIAAPAAFTRPTGEAHWEVLVRARAIETGCFVIAPAQGGRHEDGRGTWGRSMVVDPWGAVVASLDHDEPALLIADLDLASVDAARAKIPSLQHDRDFSRPTAHAEPAAP